MTEACRKCGRPPVGEAGYCERCVLDYQFGRLHDALPGESKAISADMVEVGRIPSHAPAGRRRVLRIIRRLQWVAQEDRHGHDRAERSALWWVLNRLLHLESEQAGEE